MQNKGALSSLRACFRNADPGEHLQPVSIPIFPHQEDGTFPAGNLSLPHAWPWGLVGSASCLQQGRALTGSTYEHTTLSQPREEAYREARDPIQGQSETLNQRTGVGAAAEASLIACEPSGRTLWDGRGHFATRGKGLAPG